MTCDWCGEFFTENETRWVRLVKTFDGQEELNQNFHVGECYALGLQHSRNKETRFYKETRF